MLKIAESLKEFNESKIEEKDINEVRGLFGDLKSYSEQFRSMFLTGAYVALTKGRNENVKSLYIWLKKMNELGWAKNSIVKEKLGSKNYKSFQAVIKFLNNLLPSFTATPGGTTNSNSGKTGKDDQERAKLIANVIGINSDELFKLLEKK